MTYEFMHTYVRTVFMFGYPFLACFLYVVTAAPRAEARGLDLDVIGKGWMTYILFAILFCLSLLGIGLKAVEDLLLTFPGRPLLGPAGLLVVVAFCVVFTSINWLFISFHPLGLNAVRIFLFLFPWVIDYYPFAVYALAGFSWEEYTQTLSAEDTFIFAYLTWPWLLYFLASPRIRKNWPKAGALFKK